MKARAIMKNKIGDKKGVSAVIIAICLLLFVSFTALAIDVGHLYLVRNELKNAADAGALAGARSLFNEDGSINAGANQEAHDVALLNVSEKTAVEVNWTSGNTGDVERGHWRFSDKSFTPNSNLTQVTLHDVTTAELDADTNFINAVRVKTRREATPVVAFLAQIFGIDNFILTSESVAYIGFAGQLNPLEADAPIAVCKQALLSGGEYTCNVGRMLADTGDTAGWTNFEQPSEGDTCGGAASSNDVRNILNDGGGNSAPIIFGLPIEATNGVQASTFNLFRDIWLNRENDQESWNLILPVIDCSDDMKILSCSNVVGAVTVEVVWITESGEDPHFDGVPRQMDDWTAPNDGNTEDDRKTIWNDFADHFNLRLPDGQMAYWNNVYGSNTYGYGQKTVYFKPSCEVYTPTGTTGGQNFGVLAEIPVLVY